MIRLISAYSRYPQMIRLRVNKGGYLLCDGKKAANRIVCGQDAHEEEISGSAGNGGLRGFNT